MVKKASSIFNSLGLLILAGCQEQPTVSSDTEEKPTLQSSEELKEFYNSNRKVFDLRQGTTGLAKASGPWGSVYDASGRIELKIWECTGAGQHVSVSCTVDPQYVLVGGGGWANYGSGPGVLLTASFPNGEALTTWTARSKDHLQKSSHTLRWTPLFGQETEDFMLRNPVIV